MKKVMKGLWIGSLVAGLLAGSMLVARADDDKPMMGGEDGGTGRIEKMKEKLGLSDSQVTQMKDLFKKQMEGNKPLRDQMKIDMDTLQQKVDLKASDSDIQKLLDKLEGEQKEMSRSREKMKDQLKSILNPTQQAKFVLGMRARGKEMMGKWMKRRKDGMNKGSHSSPEAPAGDQDSDAGK